jgi:hypothetical protein
VYGTPQVKFTIEKPGNFISKFSYSPNSLTDELTTKNNLNRIIEKISKMLLQAFLENPELAKRCLGRSKVSTTENNFSNMELFSCVEKDDTFVLTSEVFGVEINFTDTGKNFIFSARNLKSSSDDDKKIHHMLQKMLEETNYLWGSFTKEIIIGVNYIDFTNEKNDLYGYSPFKIAINILKYLPDVDDDIGFRLQPEKILDSFHSFDNEGAILFNLYGVDVFFRLNLKDKSQVERQATAVKVLDDKILMRQATPMAELIIRSSFTPFHLSNQSFDYADEQKNMLRVARIIHLGLSQWAEGDFNKLGS